MLFETKSEVDIHEMSPLALAFVGDAVLELLVRARLVGTTRLQPNRLHTVATHYVSAHAQNLELAVIEPMLTDAEAAVLRRGKNASKATVAKHATVQEYRASTGFECLLGWLYLQGRNDRIQELFDALSIGPLGRRCLAGRCKYRPLPITRQSHFMYPRHHGAARLTCCFCCRWYWWYWWCGSWSSAGYGWSFSG